MAARKKPGAPAGLDDLMGRLRTVGEELPEALARELVACGEAAVPALIAVLEETGHATAAEAWAPVHAATILGELAHPSAVAPLLRVLAATEGEDALHDRAILALAKHGAAVVEPALAAHEATDDAELRMAIRNVLGEAGVRDERIFRLLAGVEPFTPWAAMDLAAYGDPRGLAPISAALDRADVQDGPFFGFDVRELAWAVEELGGTLTPSQAAKRATAAAPVRGARGALTYVPREGEEVQPSRPPPAARPGRNDPCHCGSGKKYKKCHLDADEGR